MRPSAGANAAVCRRVLAVGRTGLLAGSSSACLGRALRKYDAASSGCPCPHPRRYPCHDPCRSPVRQRTRIGIRIGTRIRMAHRHCRRPFLARSSCRGQRLRFAAGVLAGRQERFVGRVISAPRLWHRPIVVPRRPVLFRRFGRNAIDCARRDQPTAPQSPAPPSHIAPPPRHRRRWGRSMTQ